MLGGLGFRVQGLGFREKNSGSRFELFLGRSHRCFAGFSYSFNTSLAWLSGKPRGVAWAGVGRSAKSVRTSLIIYFSPSFTV